MGFRKSHEATGLEFPIIKKCKQPVLQTSNIPLLPKKTTQNLQVIKFLQCYIWCEHIQYSNDLKIKGKGEKKTWINTALTQIPELRSKWRNMIKNIFIMRLTTGIKMAERIPDLVPSNIRIRYVLFFNSKGQF